MLNWISTDTTSLSEITFYGLESSTLYKYRLVTNCCGSENISIINFAETKPVACISLESSIIGYTSYSIHVSWNRLPSVRVQIKGSIPALSRTYILSYQDTSLNILNLNPCTEYVIKVESLCDYMGTSTNYTHQFTVKTSRNCSSLSYFVFDQIANDEFMIHWERVISAYEYELRYRIVGSNSWQYHYASKNRYDSYSFTQPQIVWQKSYGGEAGDMCLEIIQNSPWWE